MPPNTPSLSGPAQKDPPTGWPCCASAAGRPWSSRRRRPGRPRPAPRHRRRGRRTRPSAGRGTEPCGITGRIGKGQQVVHDLANLLASASRIISSLFSLLFALLSSLVVSSLSSSLLCSLLCSALSHAPAGQHRTACHDRPPSIWTCPELEPRAYWRAAEPSSPSSANILEDKGDEGSFSYILIYS